MEEEEEDEELDVERVIREVESSGTFGGEGVRALTSTTLKLNTDSDDVIAEEVRAFAETSVDAAGGSETDTVLVTPPAGSGGFALLERGDEDRERGAASTTFNAVDEEELGAFISGETNDVSQVELCIPATRPRRQGLPRARRLPRRNCRFYAAIAHCFAYLRTTFLSLSKVISLPHRRD